LTFYICTFSSSLNILLLCPNLILYPCSNSSILSSADIIDDDEEEEVAVAVIEEVEG
jgi:hypothetical protein